jgi:hypothetical protein
MVNSQVNFPNITSLQRNVLNKNNSNINLTEEQYKDIEETIRQYITALRQLIINSQNRNNLFGTNNFKIFSDDLIRRLAIITKTLAKLKNYYFSILTKERFNNNRNMVKQSIADATSINGTQANILRSILLNVNNAINNQGALKLKPGQTTLSYISRGKYIINNMKEFAQYQTREENEKQRQNERFRRINERGERANLNAANAVQAAAVKEAFANEERTAARANEERKELANLNAANAVQAAAVKEAFANEERTAARANEERKGLGNFLSALEQADKELSNVRNRPSYINALMRQVSN